MLHLLFLYVSLSLSKSGCPFWSETSFKASIATSYGEALPFDYLRLILLPVLSFLRHRFSAMQSPVHVMASPKKLDFMLTCNERTHTLRAAALYGRKRYTSAKRDSSKSRALWQSSVTLDQFSQTVGTNCSNMRTRFFRPEIRMLW